jgi:arginase
MHLVIISVPYAASGLESGVGAAPTAWQAAGLAGRLAPLVAQAVWVSVPRPPARLAPEQQRIAVARQVRETVRTVLMADAFPLVLGGDPTLISLASVSGLQLAGQSPGIVWFDSRCDLTAAESPALLVGYQSSPLIQEIGVEVVPEWRTLLAGPRLMSEDTEAALEGSAITVWTARDLEVAGAQDMGREVVEWASLYLHLDLRVLDIALVRGIAGTGPGGLAWESAAAGIESIAAAAPVGVLGVTGYDPDLDEDDLGLEISLQSIETAVRILIGSQ